MRAAGNGSKVADRGGTEKAQSPTKGLLIGPMSRESGAGIPKPLGAKLRASHSKPDRKSPVIKNEARAQDRSMGAPSSSAAIAS